MNLTTSFGFFGDEITEGMGEEIEYFKKIKGEDKIKWVKSDMRNNANEEKMRKISKVR